MRIAYLVSRFPSLSETFVLRELDAVAAQPDMALSLYALFPPAAEDAVHPAAAPWLERLRRPRAAEGIRAAGWWLAREPGRLLGVLGTVAAEYAREPRVLPRALVATVLATAHARRLRADGAEHVHAHFATYPALAAWTAWRLAGIPYSFTAHAHDLFVHQAMLARKADDAEFVVAISDYNRRFILDHADGRAPAVELVHCGVDPSRLPYRERRLPDAGPVEALCVAGLRASKGHAVLLEALAGAAAPLDRVRLALVGDGPLRAELEQRAHALGLGSRVEFAGGLPEPEVARRLEAADLFVLPSVVAPDGDMEGIPVALMEALATGVPAIATRQSGIPELVRDGETGLLAAPGDVAGLRAALATVLGDPDAAAARARAGRALVEREFDLARSAARLAALFAGAGQAAFRPAETSESNGQISS
jgi:colanic acid/amylovoran biosynthesis glycosyltransferase